MGSHEYYTQADFYTGARIEFNKFGFVLYQADEYSLSYMESDPESHPMSDLAYITISYDLLQDVLSENDMELTDQVLITMMRRFDLNKDGNISYPDFLSL